MTESFKEIETVEGENTSPPSPTSTVVVAAEDFCAITMQNKNAATMAVALLRKVLTMAKSKASPFLFQKFR
jgi:hypothetical protein